MSFTRSDQSNFDSRVSKEKRDFYFGSMPQKTNNEVKKLIGNRNEEWLKALKIAKKQYQDRANRTTSSK